MNLTGLIGIKQSQSQQFNSAGFRIPVTRIHTGPLFVVRIKTAEKDGYSAVVLGLGSRRMTIHSKAVQGTIKKAGLDTHPPRFLQEIRLSGTDETEPIVPGTQLKASQILTIGDSITVTGISKGKGFAGGVKRHHFKGGPRTHGQSDRERAPGSIGQTTTPGRVYKGKRMAGRMGNDRVTVSNLKVIAVDDENDTLVVSGVVPGGKNGVVMIMKTREKS